MVNVYAIAFLFCGNSIILERRCSVGFGTGMYHLVGGKVKQGETANEAACREVREKTDLDIPKESFTLVHTLHRKGTETEFVALVFAADISHLPAPHITELDKYDDMQLFPLDQLPTNTLPAHLQVIRCIQKGIRYSEHGW